MTTNDHRPVLRGELVLVLAVIINSIGVLLMLHSGSGISAISSVPYAFNLVLPKLSLGTWTYIFQGLLVCVLMNFAANSFLLIYSALLSVFASAK